MDKHHIYIWFNMCCVSWMKNYTHSLKHRHVSVLNLPAQHYHSASQANCAVPPKIGSILNTALHLPAKPLTARATEVCLFEYRQYTQSLGWQFFPLVAGVS